jgi:hypothetical protein
MVTMAFFGPCRAVWPALVGGPSKRRKHVRAPASILAAIPALARVTARHTGRTNVRKHVLLQVAVTSLLSHTHTHTHTHSLCRLTSAYGRSQGIIGSFYSRFLILAGEERLMLCLTKLRRESGS